MLDPAEARKTVLERIPRPDSDETTPLESAAARILAEPAVSDVDVPPFEKSMMDGYALRGADLAGLEQGAERRLACVGESRAGAPFAGDVPAGSCIEIYTGAELPPSCDTVEMVERTRQEGDEVAFSRPLPPGTNVSHRAEILARGRTVFEPGRRLSPPDLLVLATIGLDPVPVFPRPRVSVLTTGDELVPASEVPGPGQIREGNTAFLAAACERLGCTVRRAGILADERERLEEAFAAALDEGEALVTTGGVSVGKYDLVGAAFEAIGVEPVLHKVAIKPGKPIWFGMRGGKPVFGLPGNPVSALLGFEVFVRPALARLAGADPSEEAERLGRARWTGAPKRAGDRQTNLPARLQPSDEGLPTLEPVPFRGSADVVAASLANALVVIPAGGEIAPGETVLYRPLSF